MRKSEANRTILFNSLRSRRSRIFCEFTQLIIGRSHLRFHVLSSWIFSEVVWNVVEKRKRTQQFVFLFCCRLTHFRYFLTSAFCCSRLFVVINTFLYMRWIFLISWAVKSSSRSGSENRVNIIEAFESMAKMESAERPQRWCQMHKNRTCKSRILLSWTQTKHLGRYLTLRYSGYCIITLFLPYLART